MDTHEQMSSNATTDIDHRTNTDGAAPVDDHDVDGDDDDDNDTTAMQKAFVKGTLSKWTNYILGNFIHLITKIHFSRLARALF